MPVLAARTRRQLRASVLYNAGAIIEITASATGLTTTVVTNQLPLGATDDYRGWRIWPTSGTNANLLRTVTASSVAASVTTLTIAPALTDATAANDTFQLIGKSGLEIHPDIVNEYINQAIIEVTGLAYVPVESLALHGDGRQSRFDVPSTLTMISGVYSRHYVESTLIHDAATEWDEASAPSNVTRTVSTTDYKVIGASNRFVIAGAFSTGLVSSKAITSLDLSGYDYVEFWIKSTTATAAGDFTLLLDDTALAVSALETLSIPALVADTWTFVRIALANPELDTAIISVGLNAAVNIAANTVWISDVRAVLDSTAKWVLKDRNNWRCEENTRDLVFRSAPGPYLLKLTGGNSPSLLSADATANTIDDDFVIARATERTLLSQGGGPSTDPDALRSLASYWGKRADEAKASLPWLEGMRVVS